MTDFKMLWNQFPLGVKVLVICAVIMVLFNTSIWILEL